MSLESATLIDDLDSSNPTAGDTKSQGDDHLRLIKSVLKASIKRVSRAFYVQGFSASKTADFSVASTDDNRIFLVDTSSGTITATLPTLVSADAGWECSFIKTNTGTNAFWIAPASGTLQSGDLSGLAKTRRVIPGVPSRAIWTGSAWMLTRAVNVPVGAILDFDGGSLPVGYEWPNGQTLSGTTSSVYPDYYARKTSLITPDLKGRAVFGKDDMGGVAASRITTALSSVDGLTLRAAGGSQTWTLRQTDLPNATLAVTVSVVDPGHEHFTIAAVTDTTSSPGTSSISNANYLVRLFQNGASVQNYTLHGGVTAATVGRTSSSTTGITASGTSASLNGNVSQTNITLLPPMMILNKILVVE